MTTIADFTDSEQRLVSNVLFQRYGKFVPLQVADAELQLDMASEDLTPCPTLFWSELGAQFVLCKVGESRYRCQFFYSDAEQFGTGRNEYADIEECVMTLLQVQSDHERQRAGLFSGATAADVANDDDYHGPVMI